jgi:hypothetical protein
MKAEIASFASEATALMYRTGPAGPGWQQMLSRLQHAGVPVADAFSAIQPAAATFLQRYVAFAFADGGVDQREIDVFRQYASNLGTSASLVDPLLQQLNRGLLLSSVRAGVMPRFRPSDIYLESDEFCHLDISGSYERVLAASVTHVPGRILVTNRRFHFLEHAGGWELPWSKIMRIRQDSTASLHLQISQKRGAGRYFVADPEYATAVVDAVARISRREILRRDAGRDTRRVPQEVKAAVWQRDAGRCVECGSTSYLEFDHVIPLSKGGATSPGNLQLLCRGCNLRKANRL